MPEIINSDAMSFFEGSVESLHIAISSLGSTKRAVYIKDPNYAPEIGLIGVSAELAMSGCLVQAKGINTLQISGTSKFKPFPTILSEFRFLIRNEPDKVPFLFKNLDYAEHSTDLIDKTLQFSTLSVMRASAFHAGKSLTHELTVFQANIISVFLETLSKSQDIKNILGDIPRILIQYKERRELVEDLARRLEKQDYGSNEFISTLQSIFLVFPNMPDKKPEWLDAFERLAIAPNENDIVYLLNILEAALPVSLRRVSTNNPISIPVRYAPKDPKALPSSPHSWSKSFNHVSERFSASVGKANGLYSENKAFNPESRSEIYELFSVGLVNAGVIEKQEPLTAQAAWCWIASSLSSQGVILPYCFIISHVENLGELKSFLSKIVIDAGNAYLKRNISECEDYIDTIIKKDKLSKQNPLYIDFITFSQLAEKKKAGLLLKANNWVDEENTQSRQPLLKHIEDYVGGALPLKDCVNIFKNSKQISSEDLIYWLDKFAESTYDYDDRVWLLEHYQIAKPQIKTPIHKALRCMDIQKFAPLP